MDEIGPARRLAPLLSFLLAFIPATTGARAQSNTPGGMPPPPGMSLAASASMRFPQPVRVGNLIGEDVLEPVESQNVLGTVKQVVRDGNGVLSIIVNYGGFLGFGARPIAVPIDATVLVGNVMEVVAYTPKQLQSFPTYSSNGATPISSDAIIKIGLAKPSH